VTYDPSAPPPPPAAANDKTTLWGVLGIIFAFCCWPLGLVFSILAIREAKNAGKPATLGIIGIVIIVIAFIVNIILFATGQLSSLTGSSS
jgi:multisubunit Na+/H+ antiporter MnhG subunit